MRTCIAAVLASGLAASAASAQQVNGSNVHFELSWYDTVNTNGILEPGESAVISLTVTMTPGANSPITWNTVIGGSGTGVLRGIQTVFVDLVGSANASGIWSNLQVHEIWDLIGPPGYGTPNLSGTGLNNIQAGQFPPTQAMVNTTNPVVAIWQGTWTPNSYSVHMSTFTTTVGSANPTGFSSNVIVREGTSNVVLTGTSATTHNSIQIGVIPAPASMPLLVIAAAVAGRRRR